MSLTHPRKFLRGSPETKKMLQTQTPVPEGNDLIQVLDMKQRRSLDVNNADMPVTLKHMLQRDRGFQKFKNFQQILKSQKKVSPHDQRQQLKLKLNLALNRVQQSETKYSGGFNLEGINSKKLTFERRSVDMRRPSQQQEDIDQQLFSIDCLSRTEKKNLA